MITEKSTPLDNKTFRAMINFSFGELLEEDKKSFIESILHWDLKNLSKPIDEIINSDFELIEVCSEKRVSMEEIRNHIEKNNGFVLSNENILFLIKAPFFNKYIISMANKIAGMTPWKEIIKEFFKEIFSLSSSYYTSRICFFKEEKSNKIFLYIKLKENKKKKFQNFAYFKKKESEENYLKER